MNALDLLKIQKTGIQIEQYDNQQERLSALAPFLNTHDKASYLSDIISLLYNMPEYASSIDNIVESTKSIFSDDIIKKFISKIKEYKSYIPLPNIFLFLQIYVLLLDDSNPICSTHTLFGEANKIFNLEDATGIFKLTQRFVTLLGKEKTFNLVSKYYRKASLFVKMGLLELDDSSFHLLCDRLTCFQVGFDTDNFESCKDLLDFMIHSKWLSEFCTRRISSQDVTVYHDMEKLLGVCTTIEDKEKQAYLCTIIKKCIFDDSYKMTFLQKVFALYQSHSLEHISRSQNFIEDYLLEKDLLCVEEDKQCNKFLTILQHHIGDETIDYVQKMWGFTEDMSKRFSFHFCTTVYKLNKHFFKILYEEIDAITIRYVCSADTIELLDKVLELGQISNKECYDLMVIMYHAENLTCNLEAIPYKITCEELIYILDSNKPEELIKQLSYFAHLKVDQRFAKIKDTSYLLQLLTAQKFCTKDIHDLLEAHSRCFMDHTIAQIMVHSNPFKLSKKSFVNYYYLLSKGYVFKNEKRFEIVAFLLHSLQKDSEENLAKKELLKNGSDAQIIACLQENSEVKLFLSYVKFNQSFQEKYYDNLIKFYTQTYFPKIVQGFKNCKKETDFVKNFTLICKSVIADKYEQLKYDYDELSQEIGGKISKASYNSWKKDYMYEKDKIKIVETGDFNTTYCIGQLPTRTCMHFSDGSYRQCLLSNFDTNKKICKIFYEGKYIGRAILRLTKMSTEPSGMNSEITFKDVEAKRKKATATQENFVIFVERLYTSLDNTMLPNVQDAMQKILFKKASDMGVSLAFCSSYQFNEQLKMYFYISASKNGMQYLDSFDGGTSESGMFKEAKVYLER